MSSAGFKPGYFTPHACGTVIDVRTTPAGKWVFGVEETNGAVSYFSERALRHAQS